MMFRTDQARLFVPLIAANVLIWTVAFAAFHGTPVVLGTALLAYGLGLRHAVDADHIAAIDNVTRKLIHAGRPSVTTGLYFSLGHSTVVWLASLGIAFAATTATPGIVALREIGGTIGTAVSITFLLGIAAANIVVLKGLIGAIRRHRRCAPPGGMESDGTLALHGPCGCALGRAFRLVSQSRHMFAIGFLFGLGFDTATEIGVLGISAAAASNGMTIWTILLFPALFTAGMSLVDTADSALMTRAYRWALVEPARKLYYNLTVTFLSIIVALAVGGIEALGLLRSHLEMNAAMGDAIARLNGQMGTLGYEAVAGFAGFWLVSALIFRATRPIRGAGI